MSYSELNEFKYSLFYYKKAWAIKKEKKNLRKINHCFSKAYPKDYQKLMSLKYKKRKAIKETAKCNAQFNEYILIKLSFFYNIVLF